MERLTLYAGNGDNYESINPIDTPYEYGKLNLQKLINKLAEYEDAEEQGLLLQLPCKVGDSIYSVVEDGLTIVELKFSLDFYARRKNDFGKTVFLTQAEAEQKLKEMEQSYEQNDKNQL